MRKSILLFIALTFTSTANAAYVFTDLGEYSFENEAFELNYDRLVPRLLIAGITVTGGAGTTVNLPSQDGYNVIGRSSNSSGIIAGSRQSYQVGGPAQAITWDDGVITPLGSVYGQGTTALSINDNSEIVGQGYRNITDNSGTRTVAHAVLWKDDTVIDLGSLGGNSSMARSINNIGQIVGGSTTIEETSPFPTRTQLAATLWQDGEIINLNDMLDEELVSKHGWYLSQAMGISDTGSIVGIAFNTSDDKTHAYLLSPVPVPAAVWLFSSGLLGLIGLARRKSND